MVDGVSHYSSLSEPRLHVDRHAKEPVKSRRLYSISELSGNLDLGVNNADISTLECALLTRMYFCKVGDSFVSPPPVDKGLFTERLTDFKKLLLSKVDPPTKFSLEQVLETYTG